MDCCEAFSFRNNPKNCSLASNGSNDILSDLQGNPRSLLSKCLVESVLDIWLPDVL